MRRIIITVTAVTVLAGASVALAAAFNSYTAATSFSGGNASASKPVPLGMKQILTASGNNGNRAAPLTDLKSTITGATWLGKDYAKCSINTIATAKNDTAHPSAGISSGPCPSGALVATANVDALLGPGTDPSAHAMGITPCHPGLDVWNEGGGKLVFFFWSTATQGSAHYCGGIKTGSTPPYEGTIKNSGSNMVIDVPLPPSVSTMVLGSTTWGSLIKETITWTKQSIKVHGKSEPYFASVCKGKRNWTQKFTANFHGNVQSFTTSGKASC